MTAQGSPHSRFQRAARSGNPTLTIAAAAELEHVTLAEALQVCLVLIGAGDPRAPTALTRWLGRYCLEHRPSADEANLVLAALQALAGSARAAAGEALAELFDMRGLRDAGRVVAEWIRN